MLVFYISAMSAKWVGVIGDTQYPWFYSLFEGVVVSIVEVCNHRIVEFIGSSKIHVFHQPDSPT